MDIPETRRAMVLEAQRQPLREMEVPVPQPGPDQVLIRVAACAVCRTDLHIVDGELASQSCP
jgi:propanol-preferring alcohol dehydrogenase